MYIHRRIEAIVRQAAEGFPAVLVSGPRQSGKTTLLKTLFPKAAYRSFDDPAVQEFAVADPEGFLLQFGEQAVILDEVQYVPGLFSYLKMAIDANRHIHGKWLLTGSQHFSMMHAVSDSLAGRVALLNVFPFSYSEIPSDMSSGLQDVLWNGGYPEILLNPAIRDIWLASYIRTYIERDVRQIINVKDLGLFQTFLSLCAANHAQECNLASISRDCGVAQPTVKRWLAILEASFIITLVKPFHVNLGKRLVKSPKLYFTDSALVAWLTRQADKDALFHGAMGGAFFEGWIINEIVRVLNNTGKNGEIFFWRSREGLEIDCIIEVNGRRYPLEIKMTATPTLKHAGALEKFLKLSGTGSDRGLVVCNCREAKPLTRNVTALPWSAFMEWLQSI
ncbi:MAG TPA: ATP-binding protein [Spirochaetota bacterium]|nr:ATP-binding protein [Spirochaetota bacterium]